MRNVTRSVRGPRAVLTGSEVREMVSDGGVAISHSGEYPWPDRLRYDGIGVYGDVMRLIPRLDGDMLHVYKSRATV